MQIKEINDSLVISGKQYYILEKVNDDGAKEYAVGTRKIVIDRVDTNIIYGWDILTSWKEDKLLLNDIPILKDNKICIMDVKGPIQLAISANSRIN